MDYLKIVLQGYFNENTREHLPEYFGREQKKAEAEHYQADEFFSGCLKVVAEFDRDIYHKWKEELVNLHTLQGLAKAGKIWADDPEKERNLESVEQQLQEYKQPDKGKRYFTANLHSLTNGRYHANLYYDQVIEIQNAILEAQQQVKGEDQPAQQKQGKPIKEQRVPMNAIALYYYYSGQQINSENAEDIAKEYGYISKTSGIKLKRLYNESIKPRTRTGSIETEAQRKKRVQLLEYVINMLPPDKKGRAVDELKIVETKQVGK